MGQSSYDPVEQGPAWNAGRKLGAKLPLKPKEIWEIRFMLIASIGCETGRCSTSRSTANSAGAILSKCGSAIS